jgi:hypothetical protein
MKRSILLSALFALTFIACSSDEGNSPGEHSDLPGGKSSPSSGQGDNPPNVQATQNVFGTLMLQNTDLSGGANWTVAKSICENSNVDGYNDWRLPNLAELGVIYSNKSSINELSYYYWSSEASGSTSSGYYYYYYNMTSGEVSSSNYSYNRAVRCVRTTTNSGGNNSASSTKLTIRNESSYDVKNVIWNNTSFGEIKKGFSVGKAVNAGNGYIYFIKTAEDLEIRTDDRVVVEQGEQEFVIQNTTLVLEIANSENKKTLNAIEATPPIFGTLMLQGKDLSTSATWGSADDLCNGSEINGYSDWRLPTRSELGVIYNNKSVISGLNGSFYWSSEKYGSYYYYYDMRSGAVDYGDEDYGKAVRCVRTI